MQSFDFKKLLPHLYIILGLLVLALIFSYPQLNGMKLYQGDSVSWKASATEAIEWHEKTGENTLWSNSMFGGMPTYTHYVPELNNYIYPIQKGIMGLLGKPAGFIFLAMLGFYILATTWGINRWLAAAGSIAYGFSSYNITLIAAGHETKMFALAYMPVVIAGLLLIYRSKWWTGIPILGISLALMMTTSHYQVMYYTIMIIVGIVIVQFVEAIKSKNLKQFFIGSAVALVIAAISIGPSMQLFLATLQYNKTTMRGGESELTINHDKDKKSGGLDKTYAFRWSNAWGESFCVLVPFLYGSSNQEDVGENSETYEVMTNLGVPEQSAAGFVSHLPTYWGPQPFTGGPFYFGAVICFLFVLGLMIVKSKHKWWIVGVSVFAFLYSVGKHFPSFNYFVFDTLPAFNRFRVPNMILVIPQMLFPLLAVWALNDVIKEKISKEELWKKVKMSGIITGGLCLLLAVGSSAFFSFKSQNDDRLQQQLTQSFKSEQAATQVVSAIQSDRANMAMKSGFTSALFIALAVGLLWGLYKGKVKPMQVAIGTVILIAIDLIPIDTRYLNEENFMDPDEYEALFAPRPVDRQIMQDNDPYYRVLDLSVDVYNNAMQAVHHKCIGGYSPAKMEIYQDMIDVHMNGRFNAQVLNMLNTKYIISPQGDRGQPMAIPNPNACGNAWFVSDVQWEKTADDEIMALDAELLGDTLKPGGFKPLETAVVRDKFKPELEGYKFGKDSSAYVHLTKYGLNNLSYESGNSQNGFAVFSDIYYPYGWKAYVDGQETPIIRTDYLLRGIKLPAGKHKIEFKFHPEKFYTGDKIALASSLLLILITLGSVGMSMKGNRKDA